MYNQQIIGFIGHLLKDIRQIAPCVKYRTNIEQQAQLWD